ncbi:MAG: F-type H+-transporting ATPase subunit gamma [Planctomycetota bacterium]|jgi:F-type H+-transporting ATPase subunit gamma
MQTKDIKHKIDAVQNIHKITKTMEMVSVAKMRRSANRATSSASYAKLGLELLRNIALDKDVRHPYVTGAEGTKVLYVIIGSNKGLCGGFNTNLSRLVGASVAQLGDVSLAAAITLGRQAERIALRHGLQVEASFNELDEHVTMADIVSLQSVIDDMYLSGEYTSIQVVYTDFIKSMKYQPKITQLLPFRVDTISDTDREFRLYTFEPSKEDILVSIVPGLIQAILVQMVISSAASEHSSRMVAMRGASDNANSLLEQLKLSFNKARQEAITREIAEIASGADALS